MTIALKLVQSEPQLKTAYDLIYTMYADMDFDGFKQRLQKLDTHNYHIYEILLSGEFVGVLALARFTNMISGDVMYLEELVIVPEKRGAGIGVKVLEYIKALARQESRAAVYTDDSSPLGDRAAFFAKAGGHKVSNLYKFDVI